MRYDYILIWGNGLEFKKQILEEIQRDNNFQIIKIIHHKTKNIKKLVRVIYSYDYAPMWHLKNKTQYLLKTIPEVIFIFIINLNPQEDYFGEGVFRHIESVTLKMFKENLRDKYNQRKDKRETEEHIVHASDNEVQTDQILRHLGFNNGVNYLKHEPNKIIQSKYYIKPFRQFTIQMVDIENIYCNILQGNRESYSILQVPLSETPHFACLSGNYEIYEQYVDTFLGGPLTDYYSVKKFLDLSKELLYNTNNYLNDYIIVKKITQDKFLIMDGLHRATILKTQGKKNIIVSLING